MHLPVIWMPPVSQFNVKEALDRFRKDYDGYACITFFEDLTTAEAPGMNLEIVPIGNELDSRIIERAGGEKQIETPIPHVFNFLFSSHARNYTRYNFFACDARGKFQRIQLEFPLEDIDGDGGSTGGQWELRSYQLDDHPTKGFAVYPRNLFGVRV